MNFYLCAQFGTRIPVRVCDLSNEEGNPLNERELVAGASLLLDVKGKSFPVTFIGSEGEYHIGNFQVECTSIST